MHENAILLNMANETYRLLIVWGCEPVLHLPIYCIKKRKFKQWLSTFTPISTKRTITSHLNHCRQRAPVENVSSTSGML